MKNYYEILGVEHDASFKEIKVVYRNLAREMHPDLNNNEKTENFNKISEAYEVLSSPDKRKEYDQKLFSDKGIFVANSVSNVAKEVDADTVLNALFKPNKKNKNKGLFSFLKR